MGRFASVEVNTRQVAQNQAQQLAGSALWIVPVGMVVAFGVCSKNKLSGHFARVGEH